MGPRPPTAAKRVRTAGFGAYEGPLNTAVKGKGAPTRTLDAEVNVTGKSTVRVAETFDLRGCPVMARSDPREHLVQIEFALMIALGSCGGTMSRRRSPRIELAFSGSFPPMLRGSLCQAGRLPEIADGPEGKCPDISSHPEAATPTRFPDSLRRPDDGIARGRPCPRTPNETT